MYQITIYKEITSYPETFCYPEQTTVLEREIDCDDLGDLINTLRSQVSDLACWGEWSSSQPSIMGGRHCDWLTSYEESDYHTGDSTRYSVHISVPEGVEVDMSAVNEAMGV